MDNIYPERIEEEPEYIELVTGGPKKYLNRKTIRNPRYVKPPKQPKNVIGLHPEIIEAFRLARKAKYLTQKELGQLLRTNQTPIEPHRGRFSFSLVIRNYAILMSCPANHDSCFPRATITS